MATDIIPRYVAGPDSLTADDFETASIRSAAPSYTSDAPSYHSTVPNFEPVPPYSPRERRTASGPSSSSAPQQSTAPSLLPRAPEGFVAPGLPPIPPASSAPLLPSRRTELPNLGAFRIPTWSNIATNPNARLYHSVAKRRAAAASSSSAAGAAASLKRIMLDRIEEEERARIRPLEDPYLVGEVAARQAREERLARENGDDILILEDRRWDWFLRSQGAAAMQSFARPATLPNRYNGPLRAAFM